MVNWVCLALLECILMLHGVGSYPQGANIPAAACDSMIPNPNPGNATVAGHGASPQTSASPFYLTVDATKYTPGQGISVSLMGPNYYEGFMIQARSKSNERVGTWQTSNLTALNLNCNGTNGKALVHKEELHDIGNLTFTWVAPAAGTGDVTFYATVVQGRQLFWTAFQAPSVLAEDTSTNPSAAQVARSSVNVAVILILSVLRCSLL